LETLKPAKSQTTDYFRLDPSGQQSLMSGGSDSGFNRRSSAGCRWWSTNWAQWPTHI